MTTLMEVFGSDLDFNKYSAFEAELLSLVTDLRQKDFEKPRKVLRSDAEKLLQTWAALIGEDPERFEQLIEERLALRKWNLEDLNEFGPGSRSMRV